MNMMNQQVESGQSALAEFASQMENTSDPDDDAEPVEASAQSLFDRFAWFRDRQIKGKIHTIFGSFFGVCLAMALVLSLGLAELYSRAQDSLEVSSGVLASAELRGTTGEMRYNTVRYILGQEGEALERQRESFASAQARLDELNPIINMHLPQLSERLETTRNDLATYDATFEQLRERLQSEGQGERATALAFQLSEQGDALFVKADEFTTDLEQFSEDITQNGLDYFFTMIAIVIALGAIAALILLAGLNYLSRDFSRKIAQITHGMTLLTKGDRRFSIEGQDRKDEIGEMARALGKFKGANRQIEKWARERAERAEKEIRMQQERALEREEAEQRKASMMAEVAQNLERTVGEVVNSVAAASSQLQSTATRMSQTAEQTSTRTNELSQDMAEANSGATAAAAASDEFALSINEISRQAASSSQLARQATDATEEADITISALSDSANEVGQVVDLISTIAQRTNLLALNASIEAARGGEAGRGFAVVASEVKELAMQTSRATEQIAEQIRAMQDTTGASVTALRAIAGQVRELETNAVAIASAVDQQSVAGQDLARSIDLAARGTEKVAGHAEDVRELSLSTGAAASQVLSSATDLDGQAKTLNEQVEAFLRQVRAG